MSDPLLAAVASTLERRGIRYSLIGAAALAVHGVARSTFDLDLLTTDQAALDTETWTTLQATRRADVLIRCGDADDPLAGVVRIEAEAERSVDVVVARLSWQADIVGRAEPVLIEGKSVPVVRASDLILLKLYAGGSQDRWDIEQLLATPERDALVGEVESRLDLLPHDAREMWAALTSRR